MFVKFDISKKRIILQTKRGAAVRQIKIGNLNKIKATIITMVTNDKKRPVMLIKIPKEYDIVSVLGIVQITNRIFIGSASIYTACYSSGSRISRRGRQAH